VSQLGSAASDQSRPLDSRETYLERVEELGERYEGQEIPRPPHWTGFRLVPEAIEFWIDRANRLHERRRFTREGEGWTSTLLYP
jgi:pyridoxamine 5'-phosphate oxidase